MGNRTDLGGLATTGNRYSTFKSSTYYYDADGNVIQKYNNSGLFNRQWYWNARGQFDSAIKDSWFRTTFEYNALGKPVRIWDGDPNGRHIARYLLGDGDALLAEFTPSAGREVDYIYLPGTIDRPFAHTGGATTPTPIRRYRGGAQGHAREQEKSGGDSRHWRADALSEAARLRHCSRGSRRARIGPASAGVRPRYKSHNTSSSNHMAVATPSHGTLSPYRGKPLVARGGRGSSVSAFLTEVSRAAYRMLTRVASIIGLRSAMHTAETEATKETKKTRDGCVEVHGDEKQDRAEIRAVQQIYDMGDEVIAARVKAMYPPKRG